MGRQCFKQKDVNILAKDGGLKKVKDEEDEKKRKKRGAPT